MEIALSNIQRQGKSNPLHAILASDRMTRLGYSLDEINAYLRETPFDNFVEATHTENEHGVGNG
ncbi:hypothetical protein V6X63_07730 [Spiribacter sp. 221]|uniref:hypothetical protein n=1 Tax=Spiribacter onubensis TaxID=3122420 RepID=UPI00349FC05E